MLANLLSMSGVNVLKSLSQFLMTILVTRVVSPQEFGLVAFSMPFIAFVALLTDLGLSSALVQREKMDAQDAGAAITMMIVVGLGCATLLAVASRPLADAVDMAGLASVLAALSASVVLSIAALGPRAILERTLRYRLVAGVEAASVIIASCACVLALFAGWGIWALIGYYLLSQLTRSVSFAVLARRHYHLNFQWHRVRSILTFGGWVLASNILNFLARNAGNLLIGAKLGAASVGLFALSYQFMMLPLMAITWPGSGVLMATLSRSAGSASEGQRDRLICALFGLTAMVTFPAMIYLTFGLSYPVAAYLSPSWDAVVPLIAILAPAGAAQSIASYVGAILLSRGDAQLQFWVSGVNSIAMVLSFFVALPFGLIAVCQFYALVSTVICMLMVLIGARRAGLSFAALLGSLLPGFLAAALGLALVLSIGAGSTVGSWLLASLIYFGAVVAVGAAFRHRLQAHIYRLVGRFTETVNVN